MIRAHFSITSDPFVTDSATSLLSHQQRCFDILKVHNAQGGLCIVLGEPGTGKTILKNTVIHHDPKNWITPVINRSLHTWPNMLRLLCDAFDLDNSGHAHKCEARLIKAARELNNKGKHIIPIIDDAHLVPIDALRKMRLLLEDFPKNHNLILFGQTEFNTTLQLRPNEDIRSRVTYSELLRPLSTASITEFIYAQLDRVGLAHTTISEPAIALIARSSDGVLRHVKNLCIGGMIEAVRDQTRIVDTKQINAVLMQPHWKAQRDHERHETIKFTKEKPKLSDYQ
ncbi:MAG: AAA family ATPase [Verrucomicrobiota bacterium]